MGTVCGRPIPQDVVRTSGVDGRPIASCGRAVWWRDGAVSRVEGVAVRWQSDVSFQGLY